MGTFSLVGNVDQSNAGQFLVGAASRALFVMWKSFPVRFVKVGSVPPTVLSALS